VCGVIAFFIATPVIKRFDKKPVVAVSLATFYLAVIIPFVMRMTGLIGSAQDIGIFVFIFIAYSLGTMCTVLTGVTLLSMWGDVADEQEFHTGKRNEALLFALRTFAGKAGSGFGHIVAGFGLDIIKFPRDAQPGEVPKHLVDRLAYLNIPMLTICGSIALFAYSTYPLTRTVHAELMEKLKIKRLSTAPLNTSAEDDEHL
jgi:Na+/melibiose symporter-like transporter